jgi:hypothetical protein
MKIGLIFIQFFLLCLQNVQAESELDCAGVNHPAHQDEYKQCLRAQIAIKASQGGVDCYECIFPQEGPASSDLVEAISVAIQPATYLIANFATAYYANKTQEAAAKAYASGFTECTNRFNSFLNYNTTIGNNPVSFTDANNASCNGYGYGQYAGYNGSTSNGYGGYGNPFLSTGYTSGFMSGWGGPFTTGSISSINNNGMTSAAIGVSGTLTTSTTGVTTGFGF